MNWSNRVAFAIAWLLAIARPIAMDNLLRMRVSEKFLGPEEIEVRDSSHAASTAGLTKDARSTLGAMIRFECFGVMNTQ